MERRMWKKHDDAVGANSDSAGETPDLSSLGDALAESLVNDQFQEEKFGIVPQKAAAENHKQPLPSLKTYTNAVSEFTKTATAFIEQLPLLSKARGAYEEAMRASAEMRKILDADEENLRTLMTRLEQAVNPAAEKKNPEAAKVERIRAEGGGRIIGLP